MRIEEDEKLDFDDVLIKPKRSTLNSRSDVDLTRTYTFVNSNRNYEGIPIIAANMDTVGTLEMARTLGKFQIGTALHKHYEPIVSLGFYNKNLDIKDNVFYSMGITDFDLEKYHSLTIRMRKESKPTNICIDVANGYSEPFLDFVKQFREKNPEITIMAGNVVTAEMTEALILGGADIVKVGIGPGCFPPNQKVKTQRGDIPIIDVGIGDAVLSHRGRWCTVTDQFEFDDKKEIIKVNNIEVTPNHEFYVVHKKYINTLTDNNIHDYAEWISAENLTKDYMLIEIESYIFPCNIITDYDYHHLTEKYDGYVGDHNRKIEEGIFLWFGENYPKLIHNKDFGGTFCSNEGMMWWIDDKDAATRFKLTFVGEKWTK